VNAASYERMAIAPGELVSISGYRLGPSEGVGLGDASAAGVHVSIGGVDAPVLYASDEYLRVQVPYELAGKDSTTIQVRYNDASAEDVLADVLPAYPGILFPVLNDDGTPNGTRTPAARGSLITIYGTGQGVVDPPVPTGEKASPDTKSLIADAAVEIEGVAAEVKAAYMVPGAIGIFRIDAIVPKSVGAGGYLTLKVSAAKVAVEMTNAIFVR
jgi:uncharacterized protein (TIGR03437 family)